MLRQQIVDLLYQGESVAARVTPIGIGTRAWIGIHPYGVNPDSGMTSRVSKDRPVLFRVRCIELANDFDLEHFDFHGDECDYRFDMRCRSLNEVEELILSVLPDFQELNDARLLDYPF